VRRRLAVLLAVAAVFPAAAPAQTTAPPAAAARAYLVANGATGELLLDENADARFPIASITKLMTALVTLDHARPGERVTVGRLASSVGESSIHLRRGERLTVRDLLAAALIQSANDATFALAGHVGPDVRGFVRRMNRKARALGLDDTHFVRPDGLDTPGHLSSAHDVFALARAAMRKPLIRSLVRRDSARIAGGRSLFAWNDLLGEYPGLIGVKTGHTDAAGWCQVAAARRDGLTIYAVILGSPMRARRNADLAKLLTWGFAQYARADVVDDERTYATAGVPFSDERLRLVAAEDVSAVVRLGRQLTEHVVTPSVVDLPVEAGEALGEVRVLEGDRVVARRPLVAVEAVGEAGFGVRARWYADRTLDEAAALVDDVLGAVS
jgi:serine-type D-Ala-D-Ala carboxypeptidase (penicillin-binding protein 5/6)